jgi:hypothetical protein
MAAVYVNNLVINSGSDFSQSFTLEGSDDNSPFNLTDYEVDAQMRKWSGSSTAINFSTNIIAPSTSGRISIGLTSGQTIDLKSGRYVYDILITDTYGIKNRVIEGMVLVREGVTR